MGVSINTNKTLGVGSGSRIIAPQTSAFTNTKSVEFDGTNDYISLSSATTHSDNLSVSFWIKGENVGLCNVFGGTGLFQFFGSNDNSGHFRIYNQTAGGWKNIMLNFFDNTWKHAVLTVENKSTVKAYADGVLQSTHTFGGNPMNSSTINRIAKYGQSDIRFFGGKIDEIGLFNSTLTQSEITAIYNSGTPNDLSGYTSLINWWRFEEGSGTTATDSGSGGNDGTLTNGIAYSSDVP